jgi:AcrR family transcriptional regulator
MSPLTHSTRSRLIQAAWELFEQQGISETTTKQIAEKAQVNEVTLFRHFGHKHGLLLAVIEATIAAAPWHQSLPSTKESSVEKTLDNYAHTSLELLEPLAALIRSLIGESGQYPPENRRALGEIFTAVNHHLAASLQLDAEHPENCEKLASLFHALLLGYTVIELTTEAAPPWANQEDFLDNLVKLFAPTKVDTTVEDLSAPMVHLILARAKRRGLQDYALAYLLFAGGLSPEEIISLERSHLIKESKGYLLQIMSPNRRQAPLNQWVLGKRYGSLRRNPLSQWLKSRQDSAEAMFINTSGIALSLTELHQWWQELTADLVTSTSLAPTLEQAEQTWCVEMLLKDISLEELSLLKRWHLAQLQPYAIRVREKTLLDNLSSS